MGKSHQTVRVYTDGCAKGNPGPAGAAFVVEDMDGAILGEGGIALGVATNNEAEYRALILAMEHCIENEIKHGLFHTDSQLMANQINGIYRIKNERMAALARRVNELIREFDTFNLSYVPREQNKRADKLANQALADGKV